MKEGRRGNSTYKKASDTYNTAGNQTLVAQWVRHGPHESCGCSEYNTCQHSDCGTTSSGYCSCTSYSRTGASCTWRSSSQGRCYNYNSDYNYNSSGCAINYCHGENISPTADGAWSCAGVRYSRSCTIKYNTTTNTCATAACGCASYNSCYY